MIKILNSKNKFRTFIFRILDLFRISDFGFRIFLIILVYSLILLSLTIYSYSQIDLNLTLSSNSLYQNIQQQLIYLGYFNRPLSTSIFLLLIFLLSTFYFLLLYLVKKERLNKHNIFRLIFISTVILFFAYPAFSHDIFNYMFDARIVTQYHLNPYTYKALDFPTDLWIRFMHWTHRTYPYGPVWLLTTLPFSFLGLGKFVATLANFKLMFALFHFGNAYLIYRILTKTKANHSLFGLVFFAFNPLILIESLVSPHNEVVMLFFLLASIYLLIGKNIVASLVSLMLSIGVKFVTLIYLPLFILYSRFFKKSKQFPTFSKILVFSFLVPVIWEIIYREPYSWYFIIFIGLGSFLTNSKNAIILISGVSIGALLRYAPYLYQGSYPPWVIFTQTLVFTGSIAFCLSLVILDWLRIRLSK